jgi:hypothetical protein
MDFWRRAARTLEILKVRNEIIMEKVYDTDSPGMNGKQHVKVVWTIIACGR